jgi:ribosomal protein L37AE/L43A
MPETILSALKKLFVGKIDDFNRKERELRKRRPCPKCSAVCTVRMGREEWRCNQCGFQFGQPEILTKPQSRAKWLEDNPLP